MGDGGERGVGYLRVVRLMMRFMSQETPTNKEKPLDRMLVGSTSLMTWCHTQQYEASMGKCQGGAKHGLGHGVCDCTALYCTVHVAAPSPMAKPQMKSSTSATASTP